MLPDGLDRTTPRLPAPRRGRARPGGRLPLARWLVVARAPAQASRQPGQRSRRGAVQRLDPDGRYQPAAATALEPNPLAAAAQPASADTRDRPDRAVRA